MKRGTILVDNPSYFVIYLILFVLNVSFFDYLLNVLVDVLLIFLIKLLDVDRLAVLDGNMSRLDKR